MSEFNPTLREVLSRAGYVDEKDDLEDGRRSIYQKCGYLETRANAKEAWQWLRDIGIRGYNE